MSISTFALPFSMRLPKLSRKTKTLFPEHKTLESYKPEGELDRPNTTLSKPGPAVTHHAWEDLEVETLIDAMHSGKQISLHIPSDVLASVHLPALQSTLLGFDIDTGELLLESHQSMPPTLSINTPIWLQIKARDFYYRIKALVSHLDCSSSQTLLVATTVERTLTHDRRWEARLDFPKLHGPLATIELPYKKSIKVDVANISARGARLDAYGIDLRGDLTRGQHFKAQIVFNEFFTLNAVCELRHCQFSRQPSCHTQIRAVFKLMPIDAQSQIISFIEGAMLTE